MKSVKCVPRGPGIYIDGSDKTYFNNKYTSFRHAICKDVTRTNNNEIDIWKYVSNHDNIMALTQWWWPTEDVLVEHDPALDRGLHEVMVDGRHRRVHHERDQEEEDGKCADPWNNHHILTRTLNTDFKLESLHWYFQCLCQCTQYDVKLFEPCLLSLTDGN